MLPRQASGPKWFECTACGAGVDEHEIVGAQQVPCPLLGAPPRKREMPIGAIISPVVGSFCSLSSEAIAGAARSYTNATQQDHFSC